MEWVFAVLDCKIATGGVNTPNTSALMQLSLFFV